MTGANVVELTDSDFDEFISSTREPVLVDFWAPWCAPCRMLTPVVEEVATENLGRFRIAKVNVDEAPEISARFGIRSIPSLLFFLDGAKRDQALGVLGKAEIIRRLQTLA